MRGAVREQILLALDALSLRDDVIHIVMDRKADDDLPEGV